MAEVVSQRILPAPFIEAAGKTYVDDLQKAIGGYKDADLSTVYGPGFVAPESDLTTQARGLATGLGGYEPYLTQAAAFTGAPTTAQIQSYMSPYQADVIQTTLDEFDVQAAKGIPSLAAAAYGADAYGGGRAGVQRAAYQTESDRNRAALEAQLRQSGYNQALAGMDTDYRRNLQLSTAFPSAVGSQIAGLTTLGTGQQAQAQSILDAQRQLASQQLMQPLTAAQQYGSGITQLIAGYPGQTQTTTQPSPSPLSAALGTGATLAGIYRAFNPPTQTFQMKA